MNERMKYMEESVEMVSKPNAMFYEIVGLQFRKMYTGIMFPQVYIFCDI
jgi:hypothetical protein